MAFQSYGIMSAPSPIDVAHMFKTITIRRCVWCYLVWAIIAFLILFVQEFVRR